MVQKGKRGLSLATKNTEAGGDSPAMKARTEKGNYYLISGVG